MANVYVDESSLQDIADSIRAKNGTQNTYKPGQMAAAIDALPSGGITPTGTLEVTANGTYDVTNFASAEVDVPTGSAPVINSLSVTENGTYTASEGVDGYSPITVNVQSAGVSWDDICTGNQPSGDIVLTATSGIRGAFMNRYGTNPFTIRAENMLSIPQDFCRGSAYITAVYFPNATMFTQIQNFMSCTRLKIADLGKVASIGAQAFALSGIDTLILRKTNAVVTIATNSFQSTPFASGGAGGTIYIPEVLYDHLGDGTSLDYKANTNWGTLDGYGTITWDKIEGSIYELS